MEKWYEHVPEGAVEIGAIKTITRELDRWIEKLGMTYNVRVMQKTTLFGTGY